MKLLAIIGAGDLGQLIAYHLSSYENVKVVGFFDDFFSKGDQVEGIPVLGKTSEVIDQFKADKFDSLMIGIGYNHMTFRKQCFESFSGKIDFESFIHPSSFVDKSCTVGKGVFILPGCVLDRNVIIGNNVLINTGCVIAHDSTIKDHSFISPAVAMAGKSEVGECCVIGINSTIIDNIVISDEIRTGGGSVVVSSLHKKGLYLGVPATFKKNL